MFIKFFSSRNVIILLIACVFFKIYQHNLIIQLNYEKQRLIKKRISLEKERNELLATYFNQQDPLKLQTNANQKWGMKMLEAKQIMVLQAEAKIDFLHTASHHKILQGLGLLETQNSCTGVGYARS